MQTPSQCSMVVDHFSELMVGLFTKTTSVHAYNTRSSTSENFYKKTPFQELWNEIPSSLRELPKNSFKLRIKDKLLSVLEDEDSFIDICKIICKLKCH